ncbi:hypothetical protein BJY52DRAFT_1277865 [Lactarius psammicola]|nr:hypothetical protein BJY52DRAFT_1277865 [Lactarius psammicola]
MTTLLCLTSIHPRPLALPPGACPVLHRLLPIHWRSICDPTTISTKNTLCLTMSEFQVQQPNLYSAQHDVRGTSPPSIHLPRQLANSGPVPVIPPSYGGSERSLLALTLCDTPQITTTSHAQCGDDPAPGRWGVGRGTRWGFSTRAARNLGRHDTVPYCMVLQYCTSRRRWHLHVH